MSDVIGIADSLREAYEQPVLRLLRSRQSVWYVSMLEATFPNRMASVTDDAFVRSLRGCLDDLWAAGRLEGELLDGDDPVSVERLAGRLANRYGWVRSERGGSDGVVRWSLTQDALRALDVLDALHRRTRSFTSSRVRDLVNAAGRVSLALSPGDAEAVAARRASLEAQLAELDALGTRAWDPARVHEEVADLVALMAGMPSDLVGLADEVRDEVRALSHGLARADVPTGEGLAAYASGMRSLLDTEEGRSYEDACALLRAARAEEGFDEVVADVVDASRDPASPLAGDRVADDLARVWDAVYEGMDRVDAQQGRASRIAAEATSQGDLNRYAALAGTLGRVMAAASALAARRDDGLGPALPWGQLSAVALHPLATVEADLAPAPLPEAADDGVGWPDEGDLRSGGAPRTAEAIAAVLALPDLPDEVRLDEAFARLPEGLRRTADAVGLMLWAHAVGARASAVPCIWDCVDDGTATSWRSDRTWVVSREELMSYGRDEDEGHAARAAVGR